MVFDKKILDKKFWIIQKNYFKRKIKIYSILYFSSRVSFKRFDGIFVLFGVNIVHIGITDQLKGLISAYHFSKLRGTKFFVKDDGNNTLQKMGIRNAFLLSEHDFFWNPITDRVYLNYNHKQKIKAEIVILLKLTGRIFWFSNNNILQSVKELYWENDWNLLFRELFDQDQIGIGNYAIGIHVRTAGFFGDFQDSFALEETDKALQFELIDKIRTYIKSLNLSRSQIYFCSDSVFLCKKLGDISTINSSWNLDFTNKHSAEGIDDDLNNLIHDWKSLIGCRRIVSLTNPKFYKGVFPFYCSLVNNVQFNEIIIN